MGKVSVGESRARADTVDYPGGKKKGRKDKGMPADWSITKLLEAGRKKGG